MSAQVLAVHLSSRHTFSKTAVHSARFVAGVGLEGDAHSGATVKHRSRVARDPTQTNLRQVHLLHIELLQELVAKGFSVTPGSIGENITTQGIDLLALPQGTQLHIGAEAIVEVTGLRNPCSQLDTFQSGLMRAVLDRAPDGQLIRKAGIMGVVQIGGAVSVGDAIRVVLPPGPVVPLKPV
jgi:MOSC domain-containing protein YiiM